MAGPPAALKTLSYSRLGSYGKCRRQFWYAYVDKAEPDGWDRVEAWMGSRVHDTLEWALKRTLAKRVADPAQILDRFEAVWDEAVHPKIVVNKEGLTVDHYRRLGRTCVSDYLDRAWPFLRHTPVDVERRVSFDVDLASGTARFLGFVDRVDRRKDGTIRVVDYKTGGWVPDHSKPEEARQLALYWHALRPEYPQAPGALLVWNYLRHNETQRVEATPELEREAVAWVQETAADIEAELEQDSSIRAFPPNPSPLCKWCSFGYLCEANPYRASAPRPGGPGGSNASLADF